MFQSNPVLLKHLLDDVEFGRIQLPDFQRGWVWDDDRIKELLISICRGFPIGAIMTLSAGGALKLKTRPIEGVDEASAGEADAYLLDGQQRLTSLYQALRHEGPVDTHDNRKKRERRWYYVDMKAATNLNPNPEEYVISVPESRIGPRVSGKRDILDLSTCEKEYAEHMIPTEQLLDPLDWAQGYFAFCEDADHANTFFKTFRDAIASSFSEYHVPVIELDKNTPKEAVCSVFEKVNTGGVILTVFELATATFAAGAENFSLRDDWEARKARLYNVTGGVLQGLQGDNFLQTVALLKTLEERRAAANSGKPGQPPTIGCKKIDILNLSLADYHEWVDRVEEGFTKAARFLVSQYVFGKINVPYVTQLVPLAAIYVELGKELNTPNAEAKLEQWYWSGVFGEAYSSGVESKFALDLQEVPSWIRGGSPPRLVDEATFAPERLLSLWTRNSAAYKGLYALQMKHGARDWRTNSPLDTMTITTQSIDIHHVFPKAWCERKQIPSKLYNSVINKTPIIAKTNQVIGGEAPSRYVERLEKAWPSESPNVLDDALASHWLEPAHLRRDDFAASFAARGEKLLELIGSTMGRNLGSGREVFANVLARAGIQALGGVSLLNNQEGADPQEEYEEEQEPPVHGDPPYSTAV